MRDAVIFILDKNSLHRNMINYRLVTSGFTNIFSFHTAEDCVYRLMKSIYPDFLIVDYHTIENHQPDFLNHVRSISPDTVLLFISDSDDQKIASDLLIRGASDYIVKHRTVQTSISELVKNLKYLCRQKASVTR